MLDRRDYGAMTADARQAAETQLRDRDRRERLRRGDMDRVPRALRELDEDEDAMEDVRERVRRRTMEHAALGITADDMGEAFNLEVRHGPVLMLC